MNVALRPARSTDAGTTGAILARFQQDTGWLPDLYTGAETIAFCGEMIDRGWVTVAVQAGRVIGFIARDGQEVCALYVSGPASGKKVGQRLLQDAKTRSDRLWLRVFQANTGAQRFYLRAGFDEVGRGDGADNEESLPDISYVWQREGAI